MFCYTEDEQAHLKRLCETAYLYRYPRLVTGDCYRKFTADAIRRMEPCVALEKWVARCSELADECDCDFIQGEHLD